MGRLEGKVAVITGGASGIGEATVRLFSAHGARVVIADVQDERGRRLAEELGPAVAYVRTDVREERAIEGAIALAVTRWGRLDCLFNNAGGPAQVALDHEPARRIGQRREGAIQRLRLILNHVVRYLPKTVRCQVCTLSGHSQPHSPPSFRGPNEVRAPGIQ